MIMLPHHHDTVVQNFVGLMIPLIKKSFSLHICINSSALALCWQGMAVFCIMCIRKCQLLINVVSSFE